MTTGAATTRPTRLLVDHLVEPLRHLGGPAPGFLVAPRRCGPAGGLPDPGRGPGTRVGSRRRTTTCVPYAGPPPPPASGSSGGSRSGPTSVRATGRTGRTGRSACSTPSDWSARWIAPARAGTGAGRANGRPTCSATRSPLDGPPPGPGCYATAHGLYELFLNGTRVGDLELTPGLDRVPVPRSTCRPTTSPTCSSPATTSLGAVLSDGWWRGKVGFTREVRLLRDRAGAARPARGRARRTAPGSPSAPGRVGPAPPGEIVSADLIDGQARGPPPAARRLGPTGLRRRGWADAPVVDADFDGSRPRPRRRSGGSRSCARSRSPPRARAATSSTSARTSTAGCASSDLGPEGTDGHAWSTASASTTDGDVDDRAPAARSTSRPASRCRPGRSTRWSPRLARRRVRAPPHHPRLPVRRHRGPPGAARPRRRHRGRRPHRPRPHRVVLVQRRAAQPAARGRGLELPRTTPATSPPTARSGSGPAGPATGSSSAPTAAFLYDVAGFSRQVAARPRRRPVARRPGAELRARSARSDGPRATRSPGT